MTLIRCGRLVALMLALAMTAGVRAQAAASPRAAAGAFTYATGPAPAWVVAAAEAPQAAVDRSAMHYRIIDRQLLADGKSIWDYNHVVRVVDTDAGLSVASQIELEFDPSYQTFTLHHLDLVRNGKRIAKMDRRKIQLLQRETQLERRMLDGRVTVSAVLDDVRVGDEIDFAYSVRGANPVFGGKFVALEPLSSQRGPVQAYQVRLLAPVERSLQVRVGPADTVSTSQVRNGRRETSWRRVAVPRFNPDANAGFSVGAAQMLQVSEFADWAEVARWGQGLFAGLPAGPRVDAVVQEIRDKEATPADQVRAALRFVQQEVRYFGTEIGSSSHQPAAPDRVIEQRFGDCKDKVALLVALLRKLDVPATPVLVSMAARGRVGSLLPGPLAFDHVIARVELDGSTYWLDATRSRQTGQLENRQAVDFEAGLPLLASTTSMAVLPSAVDTDRQVVEDSLRFERFDADPVLESRVTFRGILAEAFRDTVTTRGPEAVQTQLAAPYLRLYPKARSLGAMEVVDSHVDDAVTFVQRFSVPGFWRFPEERMLVADIGYWATADVMLVAKAEQRRDAYAGPFLGTYRHSVALDFPGDVTSKPLSQSTTEGDAHFTWKGTFDADRKHAVYRSVLRVSADQIEAPAWPAYMEKLGKLWPKLSTNVSISTLATTDLDKLRADLNGVEEGLRSKKLKAATRIQADAHGRVVLLSAQLAAGRLTPPLQAQALTARGIQYDHLGRLADARRDFARALELAPDVTETQNAAAVNAIGLRELPRAVELTGSVLQRDPRDAEARRMRAVARYFQKDFAAAQADLEEVLTDPAAVQRGYPLLWLALAMRQAGQDPSALAARHPKEQLPADWPRPLVDYAIGTISADALIDAARATKVPAESLSEAYFYIGERYQAEGKRSRAMDFWRKSVDQGVLEFLEDMAARLRLAEPA